MGPVDHLRLRIRAFALDSNDVIIVSKDDWIGFRPGDIDPVTGLLFYPASC
jgi:hypothetical protein